ncbi:TPA: hypothetical protein ACH3X2_003765 [Trebouxia sp. C0005]
MDRSGSLSQLLLHTWGGDIKEFNDVMGIAPNSHFSDIRTLASTNRSSEPDYAPRLRTESDMREVIKEAQILEQQDPFKDAKGRLAQYFLALPQMTPLAGFNLVPDVYELYYPDRLHQSNKGTAEVLAEMVQDKVMQTGHLHMLNEYLTCLPSYFGVRIPGFGLDSKKRANATQCADLFKLLPVAILAIPGVKSLFASNSSIVGASDLARLGAAHRSAARPAA